ncbi:MAG: hypothetical protein FWG37_00725 [Clostridia bacterium]|nr:hypothetical protein [Clostridia bacterium]
MSTIIRILTTLLFAVIAADGSAAEPAPDFPNPRDIIGIATHWDFTVYPYPGVVDPGTSVYVALAEPASAIITPVPDAYNSAADAFGKGLRIWVDEHTMETLRAPQGSDPLVIRPLAVEFAGEVAYGVVDALGEWFIDLRVSGGSENGMDIVLRYRIAAETRVANLPGIGEACAVVFDAFDVALLILAMNG